jgi:hypothetical protein
MERLASDAPWALAGRTAAAATRTPAVTAMTARCMMDLMGLLALTGGIAMSGIATVNGR